MFEDRLTFVVSLHPPRGHRNLGLLILLGTWAAVFTPMALLSMAMHASLDAVRPRFLANAIRRVLAPYARLAAGVTAYVVVAWLLLDRLYSRTSSIPLRAYGTGVFAYGILVFAHILGRFYRRHANALDWDL